MIDIRHNLVALGLLCASASAQAHMTVVPSMVPVGAAEIVGFKLEHGCGGLPTTALRVELPAGVEAVEPQPKSGWTLAVDAATGATPRAVTWSGGLLPAKEVGVFAVRIKVSQVPGMLMFPAVQTCEDVSVKPGSGGSRGAQHATHHQVILIVVPAGSAK